MQVQPDDASAFTHAMAESLLSCVAGWGSRDQKMELELNAETLNS